MRKAPVIGMLPGCAEEDADLARPSIDCLRAIERAGGLAVVLDYHMTASTLERVAQKLDGVLFQGGGDVDPARYGAERLPECGPAVPRRDDMELQWFAACEARRLPVLAICRGIQLLNVARGGTLIQDLPRERGLVHAQMAERIYHHTVRTLPNTRARAAMGRETFLTNSRHHQAILAPGRGFAVTAYAEDGTVEAIEDESRFVLGLQWHPESTIDCDDYSLRPFRALVEACKGEG